MPYNKVIFTFNTKRPYTEAGQIIHVEYDPLENTTYFHDESRMVAGKFPNTYADIAQSRLEQLVMMAYDNGLYHYAPIPPSGMARRPKE
jgi:hypothetical protein